MAFGVLPETLVHINGQKVTLLSQRPMVFAGEAV